MSALLTELEQRARTLSPDERARLAEVLLESLRDTSSADVESEWAREIESRVAVHDGSEPETVSAEEVFAEAVLLVR